MIKKNILFLFYLKNSCIFVKNNLTIKSIIMNYENQKDCHLMVWEENPNKRNTNNEIKFNIPKQNTIEIGDEIRCNLGSGNFSCYEITDILETRPSSLSGFNYVTAKTKWFIK